ncbi:TorD/DmsD family molecular chaperone [Halapricum desulfuricans]|uniref:Putative component of anaerobic dehydrogenase n=1 Tax=Halapricum desulfuricans TaxID=2841257 RepID=A0A897MV72_9EURY|nr:molecular chaperone TorD family protein [Halapricum desulfuricans]QSG04462.1 putative component of anaerobic dehydrogenase [Halapricum desulfuricans]
MTDQDDAWADALVGLSNCLRHPDRAVQETLENEPDALAELLERVGVDPDEPPSVSGRDLTEDYEALFGALVTPFAPPAASPYKEWYGDRSGLMGGPPAAAMQRRYDALEATVPEAYPPDHVALQLQYAGLLAEAGERDELAAFVETELDWIDAFAALTDRAAAQAPIHRWCVQQLVAAIERLRSELGVTGPEQDRVEQMLERASTHAEG